MKRTLYPVALAFYFLFGMCGCQKQQPENPLLGEFTNPYGAAPYDKIEAKHFIPAIKEGIKQAQADLDAIVTNEEKPSFENTVVALERSGKLLSRTENLLSHLNSSETTPEIQEASRQAAPLTSAYRNDLLLNKALFARIKEVYGQKGQLKMTPEQQTLLEKTYRSFASKGANLNEKDKAKLRAINQELSELKIKFGENSLAETNNNAVIVKKENRLAGIPADAVQRAKKEAEKRNMPDAWAFSTNRTGSHAVLTYAKDRKLREEMFRAYKAKGNNGNANDNREIIKKIVVNRFEKAKLLGYKSYADMVLEDRMAKTPETVISFLDQLYDLAMPVAEHEKEELADYAEKMGLKVPLQAWDWNFYSEKLKKEKFSIDNEVLKPYFPLDSVLNGLFEITHRMYGLTFEPLNNIPVWHKDVKTFNVKDAKGKHIALFYADYFPRPGKRGGAWMNAIRSQSVGPNGEIRPHVVNICNFTPPTADKPSLLTYREVETLFHEFGHGMHGMMAQGNYAMLSGTSVSLDFVELPSQLLENWVGEKEALLLFAKHYKTGKPIPGKLVEKIKASSKYHEGYATIRQLSFGYLDMAWHSAQDKDVKAINEFAEMDDRVEAFEKKAMAKTALFPEVKGDLMSTQFGHLFAGGYAAGYYSYKWAEVLDADAFEVFKKEGIFNPETAERYRSTLLSKGGSEHPMVLYKRFSGHKPSVKALAKRAGFIKDQENK
ncbi:MAG: M3 family metallopeptidase [Cytophagales bacterium]|nr:M3 family metallopeptidase [Cytophagales bacterium]